MKKIDEILNGVSCMAIAGHVRPDGDCIGSCLGLYQYLRDNRPEIQADVYLEDPRPEFSYLPGFSEVKTVKRKRTTLWSFWMYPARNASALPHRFLQKRERRSASITM